VKVADEFLSRKPYFGGANFNAADITMFWPSCFAERINLVDMKTYPHIIAWQAKMEARPAFKRMVAVARPNGRVGPLTPLKAG